VSERARRRLAWSVWIIGVVAPVGGTAFRVIVHQPFHPADFSEPAAFAAIGLVGVIVSVHQPRNAIRSIGGSFTVVSEPEAGTRVEGRIRTGDRTVARSDT
jgi:hypothetical protein